MTTFEVRAKGSDKVLLVYSSDTDQPIEWTYYEFANYTHTPVKDAMPAAPGSPYDWLIDIGPFFDRFGALKMAVLISADPTVRAIVQDVTVRKWIDLRRPDVATALDAIASKVTGFSENLKHQILATPVSEEENRALRKLYFQG